MTLFPKSGHRLSYSAQASLNYPTSSNVAGLTFPIVECLRMRSQKISPSQQFARRLMLHSIS